MRNPIEIDVLHIYGKVIKQHDIYLTPERYYLCFIYYAPSP